MRTHQSAWSLGFAATLLLAACAGPASSPSVPNPDPINPPALSGQKNIAPPATDVGATLLPAPSNEVVSPITTAPQAPLPPNMLGNGFLNTPTGGMLSLDQMGQQLPPCIAQAQAAQYLQPLGTPLANNFGSTIPGIGAGAYAGVMPELLNYGALSTCLYYNYLGYFVPYILSNGTYFPYVYSSLYNPLLLNSCVYPLFYNYGGFAYPYYFLANDYCGGFLDNEAFWPSYRSSHDFDYDNDRRHHRWGSSDFNGWVNRNGGRNRNNNDRQSDDRQYNDRQSNDRQGQRNYGNQAPQVRPDSNDYGRRGNNERMGKKATDVSESPHSGRAAATPAKVNNDKVKGYEKVSSKKGKNSSYQGNSGRKHIRASGTDIEDPVEYIEEEDS